MLENGKDFQKHLKRSLGTKDLREANIRAKPVLVSGQPPTPLIGLPRVFWGVNDGVRHSGTSLGSRCCSIEIPLWARAALEAVAGIGPLYSPGTLRTRLFG